MTRTLRTLLAGAALLVVVGGTPAAGCSCGWERGGHFLVPAEVEIPANAPGVPWFGTLDDPEGRAGAAPDGTFRVRDLTAGRTVPAPARVQVLRQAPVLAPATHPRRWPEFVALVSPSGGFRPGARYELEYLPPGPSEGARAAAPEKVVVTVARERLEPGRAPVRLVAVDRGRGPLRVLSGRGSCSEEIRAHRVGLELRLPASLERWRDALLYATWVDAEHWRPARSLCQIVPPGRSWEDPGAELAYTDCPAEDPGSSANPAAGSERARRTQKSRLPAGRHAVEMIAWLPGTDVVLRGRTRIELGCPARP